MDSKRKRTSAKGRFTRAMNGLEAWLANEEADTENAKKYYEDVENAWKCVEEKHEEYIATLDDEAILSTEEQWIVDVQKKFQDVRKRYVKFVSAISVQSKLRSFEKARAVEYDTFLKLYRNLETSVKNTYPTETISREKIILEHQFEIVKQRHSEFCVICDDSKEKLNTTWLLTLIENFSKINSIADGYLKETKEKVSENKANKSNLKMEKMPLPKFNGESRFYQRFKRDFNELVLPNLEEREAAFIFRQCLGKEVEAVLGSGDFDVEQMLKRLDEKFGDPSKMIDSIIGEIQRFRKIENDDNKRLIDFINIIERAYHDLKSVKMEKEINNCNVVSMIEVKLPRNVALNWYRLIHSSESKVDKTDKFPHLLQFLTNERNALEYGLADLRFSSEKRFGAINHFEGDNELTCILHDTGLHKTSECLSYKKLTVKERYALLRDSFSCFSCLLPGHTTSVCNNKVKCVRGCGKYHHESLHPDGVGMYTVNHMDPSEKSGQSCIFPIMRVKVGYGLNFANVLWDSGASISLITNSKAEELGLRGIPSKISLTVVGGTEKIFDSKTYRIPMIDLMGRKFEIEVHSIDKISNEISGIDYEKVKRCFPDSPEEELKRPTGEIDILIGYNYAAWHPVREKSVGHLLILTNSFGKCVGGSHPEISEKTEKNEDISFVVNLVSSKNLLSEFSIIETLGTEFVPSCGKCQCGNCPLGGRNCSIKEEREMALIQSNLEFSVNGYWIAGYPWTKNPKNLPNNKVYALKLLIQTEKRLKGDPVYEKAYCDQINDMFSRDVARKVTDDELLNYTGPVHYIAHHAVVKSSSKTTPLRIVFNSSARFKGHVLNEYWAKGPNVFLNTLFGILIRFRENYVGFMGDISKMYNSVRTRLLDQHCHRFLWRNMNPEIQPETYVMTRVNMGDKPSGTIASLALRKTAEMKRDAFPVECETILNSSYMDDIIDSTDTVENAELVTKNITNILKVGDFNIKEWIISPGRNTADRLIDFMDAFEKVLGMSWLLQGDYFKYTVKLNFSKKRGNLRSEPDLNYETFQDAIPSVLTKRMLLSQLNGIYDPLGLLSPFTIKGKILLRHLCMTDSKIGWDDPVSSEMRSKWINFFQEMFGINNILFNRSVKPVNAVNNPTLIIFSDASKEAYGACCYVRWELNDGTYASSLLLSKSKIAPAKVVTIVRLELLAAVISKRLRETVEKECRYVFERVIHIVDSEIVRAMVQRDSYGFNTFTSTRIGEIQEGSNPNEWYWVNGENNVADLISRGEVPSNLNLGSTWQMGPGFLKLTFAEWPVRQDCSTDVLPERIEAIMKTEGKFSDVLIESDRFSKFLRLIRVTARILSLRERRGCYSFKRIVDPITVKKYDEAVLYWVKESQKSVLPELKRGIIGTGKFRKLCPILRDDGVFVVGGRASRWFEASYNKQLTPILPKGHQFSRLFAEKVHREKHVGVDSDVAKIRLEYWIIGLPQLCKSIRHKCVDCRKRSAQLSSQVMGKLPLERLKPSPPWNAVGIDLFGPFEIRGEVNKRSTGKAYGIIFVCLPTTAVYVDVANDYSTNGFLIVFRRFISLRGYPSVIYSDSGSQIVGASNILRNISKNWNWNQIIEFGIDKGIEWNFSPGDAPWWNGCCESLIRSVKKSICISIGDHRVTFSELQTVVFEAANLVNERPIGIKPGDYSEHSYLCPNDLILGRATRRVPAGPFDESRKLAKRFHFVQELVDTYWKKWILCYLPSLIIQQKWHHERRNLQIGDIVIIADKNAPRGQWKLGKVSAIEAGVDGKTRRVSIQYKNKDSKTYTEIDRPVQRVVVILPVNENEAEEPNFSVGGSVSKKSITFCVGSELMN